MEVDRKKQAMPASSRTTYQPLFWSQASKEPEKDLLAKEQELAAYREINQLLGTPLVEDEHKSGLHPHFH